MRCHDLAPYYVRHPDIQADQSIQHKFPVLSVHPSSCRGRVTVQGLYMLRYPKKTDLVFIRVTFFSSLWISVGCPHITPQRSAMPAGSSKSKAPIPTYRSVHAYTYLGCNRRSRSPLGRERGAKSQVKFNRSPRLPSPEIPEPTTPATRYQKTPKRDNQPRQIRY